MTTNHSNSSKSENRSDQRAILEHILDSTFPVDTELFKFAYNVYVDNTYRNNPPDRPSTITIYLEGIGQVEINSQVMNARAMTVWNDLLDLELPTDTCLSVIIRIMQLGHIFLHEDKLFKWFKRGEDDSMHVNPLLIEACSKVDIIFSELGGLTFDVDHLVALTEAYEIRDK